MKSHSSTAENGRCKDELDTVFFTRGLLFGREEGQEENMMCGENKSVVWAYFKKSDCNKESS